MGVISGTSTNITALLAPDGREFRGFVGERTPDKFTFKNKYIVSAFHLSLFLIQELNSFLNQYRYIQIISFNHVCFLIIYSSRQHRRKVSNSCYFRKARKNVRSPPTKNLLSIKRLTFSSSHEEQLHIIDQPWTLSNWHKHLNWLHVSILVGVPLLGLYGWFTTQLQTKTLVWAVIYYFMTGLGITAGTFASVFYFEPN